MPFATSDEMCPHCWDESVMKAPSPQAIVHRDECAYCCRECTDGSGTYVCMACFTGLCEEHVEKHVALHPTHAMFTRVKELPTEKAPEVTDSTQLGVVQPKEYEYAVCCGGCKQQFSTIPDLAAESHMGIIHAPVPGAPRATGDSAGADFMRPQCPHLVCLEQAPSPYAGRPPPSSSDVCAFDGCGCSLNNWMCVTCGAVGCPRPEAGGKGHALQHFEMTGHLTVVKLGTITPEGADFYCYGCDDEVSDVHFAAHMAHFGIDVNTAKKSAKTLGEMEYDYTLQFDFNAITEAGADLVPAHGPGLTGIRNIGNSCYIASVMQCLMSLKPFQEAFYPNGTTPHQLACRENPYNCKGCQTERIAAALLSGEFSAAAGGEQKGVVPRQLKHAYAQKHPEFSTGEQQDAQEYMQYVLEEMRRYVKLQHSGSSPHPADTFDHLMEQRVQCSQCQRVRYSTDKESCLSLSIPIDPNSAPAPEVAANLSQAEMEALRPRVTLMECLEAAVKPNPIECRCESCGAAAVYNHTTRLQSFPDTLVINVRRTYFDKQLYTTKKMDVYVEAPQDLDLEAFRARGLQPGEEAMAQVRDTRKTAKTAKADDAAVDEVALVTVVSMGIDVDVARYALLQTDMNVERAVDYIFSHPEIAQEMTDSAAAANVQETAPEASAVVATDGRASYELTAMISHIGASAKTGHYVCHVRHMGKWILFNDEKVGESLQPPFAMASTYFYKRRATA